MPPSPSLTWVHASAGLSRRFRRWLDKACKNYEELLKLGGVVDNRLRRERREELTGAERVAFTEALMEYDKLVDGLERFAKLESFRDFVSFTDENLIKWVGDEIVSLGYCGFRERSSQYWLWDYRAEKLPYEHKVREVFTFFGLDTRIRGLSVPSQEQAEAWLFEFLENIKKWPRAHIEWLVRNVYPLSDDTGGFWVVTRKVVELESLRDAWEDIIPRVDYVVDELKKTAEFQALKSIDYLGSEWKAEKYVRSLVEDVEKEFLDKYGMTTADIKKVKGEYYNRAVELLKERVISEEKLAEVYGQVVKFVPAEKVDACRAGLRMAIRWAFLYPQQDVETLGSTVFIRCAVLTSDEARLVASKILEKVVKPPVVAPPPLIAPVAPTVPPAVPERVSREEFMRAFDEALFEWIPYAIEGRKPGLAGRLHYEAPEFEAETLAKFSMDTVLSKWENVIAKEKEEAYRRYVEAKTPAHAKRHLADVPELARNLAYSLVDKTENQLFEEAKAKVVPVEKRLLRELPENVRELTEQLEMEAYSAFLAAGLPREEWLKHRASVLEEVRVAVDIYGGLPKLEAEAKVRERVSKFVSALIEKVKAPPPAVVPPEVVPTVPMVFPPAVEVVYAPREKPITPEEMEEIGKILGVASMGELLDKILRGEVKPEDVKRVHEELMAKRKVEKGKKEV